MNIDYPSEKNRTFHFVQLARCFAALLVVADHSLLDYNGVYLNSGIGTQDTAWRLGSFGVYIFFIISGFVITFGNLNNFGKGKTGDFILKSFIRIAPIYWIVSLAYIFKLSSKGVVVAWPNILTSMLFIPYGCFHATCGRPVLELGWTLQFEVFFYLLFAIALLFSRRLALSLLIPGLAAIALIGWAIDDIALPFGYYFSPILIYFLSGLLLGIFVNSSIYSNFNVLLSRIGIGSYTLLLATVLILSIYIIVKIPASGVEFVEYGCAMLLLLLCLRNIPEQDIATKSWRNRVIGVFLLLGAASYSLYLTHIFVLGSAVRIAKLVNFQIPFFIYFGAMVIATSTLAVLVYWIIERPSQSILKRICLGDKRRSIGTNQ